MRCPKPSSIVMSFLAWAHRSVNPRRLIASLVPASSAVDRAPPSCEALIPRKLCPPEASPRALAAAQRGVGSGARESGDPAEPCQRWPSREPGSARDAARAETHAASETSGGGDATKGAGWRGMAADGAAERMGRGGEVGGGAWARVARSGQAAVSSMVHAGGGWGGARPPRRFLCSAPSLAAAAAVAGSSGGSSGSMEIFNRRLKAMQVMMSAWGEWGATSHPSLPCRPAARVVTHECAAALTPTARLLRSLPPPVCCAHSHRPSAAPLPVIAHLVLQRDRAAADMTSPDNEVPRGDPLVEQVASVLLDRLAVRISPFPPYHSLSHVLDVLCCMCHAACITLPLMCHDARTAAHDRPAMASMPHSCSCSIGISAARAAVPTPHALLPPLPCPLLLPSLATHQPRAHLPHSPPRALCSASALPPRSLLLLTTTTAAAHPPLSQAPMSRPSSPPIRDPSPPQDCRRTFSCVLLLGGAALPSVLTTLLRTHRTCTDHGSLALSQHPISPWHILVRPFTHPLSASPSPLRTAAVQRVVVVDVSPTALALARAHLPAHAVCCNHAPTATDHTWTPHHTEHPAAASTVRAAASASEAAAAARVQVAFVLADEEHLPFHSRSPPATPPPSIKSLYCSSSRHPKQLCHPLFSFLSSVVRLKPPPLLVPCSSFDAVISCVGLHWVNDLPAAMAHIRRALKPDGLFLAAMLGGDTLRELRIACTLAHMERQGGVAARVAPMAQVRDAGNLLTKAGFALPTVDVDEFPVAYPSAVQVVQHLRLLGETDCTLHHSQPLPRDTALAAAAIYAHMFPACPPSAHAHSPPDLAPGVEARGDEQQGRDEDGVVATFQVIFMAGWAPHESQQRARPRGSAAVSLHALHHSLPAYP
ncbi:unnamed protein product [Closterium sp. NIES-65]|nr:unnamed protein product [Closterium sp. NIES-65]